MKRAALCLMLAACGGSPEVVPPGIVPVFEALAVVPDQVTLSGAGAGRKIAVLGRENGVWRELDDYRASSSAAARVAAGRLIATNIGVAAIEISAGGASAQLQVETRDRPPFVSELINFERGLNAGFGEESLPGVIYGPPSGGGELSGSLHVVSLGERGAIEVGFGGAWIYDGPGPDLIVFENAFRTGGETFAEPGRVEVAGGSGPWIALPCDETSWPYEGCAGVKPVIAGPHAPDVGATDVEKAGGDAIDLNGVEPIDRLRITDLGQGQNIALNAGFDLDAVALIHHLPHAPSTIRVVPDRIRLQAGEAAPLPRVDADDIRGVAANIIFDPSTALLEGALIRAVRSGTVTFTIGDRTADLIIEVVP